jgi:acetylornithine deacetylase/succinyl-diaminopimelate desuccinylase-like protein
MDTAKTKQFVERVWDQSIIPKLVEYIRIPNKSPLYDAQWREQGHMDKAVELIQAWCRAQPIPGIVVDVLKPPDRTPLIFMEIPGDSDDTILLYGHLDKQPEMTGWREGLGPWTPVIEGDKLYGRGGADDGYSAFASLTAICAMREQKAPHARCVVIIEACEESGSYDLPQYIEQLSDRIGIPSLVICLDSGCGNYSQLWGTTSLRGLVNGDLVVELLREGVHSGDASGVVADSFRIVRQLLSRLEDEETGEILPRDFYVELSKQRLEQVAQSAAILGKDVYTKFPFREGGRPVTDDVQQLILNRTWRPALSITGAAGLPSLENAGNVCRPMTAVKVSLRIPPGVDARKAGQRLKELLEKDSPYGARVHFDASQTAAGWSAPEMSPWLAQSVDQASRAFFGSKAAYMGEGGSIPFMDMLGKKYPKAQFLITGVLGPNSNAHGPNEFLHIPTGKKVTTSVAHVLADHFANRAT